MPYKCTGCDKLIPTTRTELHERAHARYGRMPHEYRPVWEETSHAYDPYDSEPYQPGPVYEFCGICGAKPDDPRHNRTYIEYPSVGATYAHEVYAVYEYGVYGNGSILQGQTRRSFIAQYETLQEAQIEHPDAIWSPGTNYAPIHIPENPPDWFDPTYAGERWEDD